MEAKTHGITKEVTIHSHSLGEEVEVLLYFPSTYSPLYKYTVLIAQDGRDYFNLGRIAKTTEELLTEREIDNTIIVGIPYIDVKDRYEKYHPNGSKHNKYQRFLAEELVPYLDSELPTYQIGMGRALIGDSLAGTASLLTALSYPNTFGKVILQSPYVNDHVKKEVEQFSQPHLLSIYHVVGSKETAVETTNGKVKDFLAPNRELNALMKNMSFTYFYDEFDGDHTWTHWQPDLHRALKMSLKL
ncbi:esterase family protein [Bacillus luteolus]|uniref:Esterase family protein n=1 Tax=Litchfieldia luteola TaxID=682179 RepID=A0ABR9QLT0_9BACI|nr:alpha/beta hydrolase-fold protein [Cytobacillus luteolus]MBE4909450.1 esterase family protein [Cytobacillus luteolus]MBP1940850.1 enterochelin esterase-like enzyme [Cytobacillus luteolus]